jgi:hypothetical protein
MTSNLICYDHNADLLRHSEPLCQGTAAVSSPPRAAQANKRALSGPLLCIAWVCISDLSNGTFDAVGDLVNLLLVYNKGWRQD